VVVLAALTALGGLVALLAETVLLGSERAGVDWAFVVAGGAVIVLRLVLGGLAL
jgi:hypothetical protein